MKIKKTDDYLITVGELRQLLYWASGGVRDKFQSGSYNRTIIPLLRRYAKDIHFTIENNDDPLRFRNL